MKIVSSLCVTVLVLAACNENAGKTNEEAKGFDSAAVSNQKSDSLPTAAAPLLMASYTGSLPCADCDAQNVSIDLLSDSSYRKKTLYMGKAGKEIIDTGKWAMKGDTLLLDVKNVPGTYIKSDSGLVQLDVKGKRITGKLADKYVLKQTH